MIGDSIQFPRIKKANVSLGRKLILIKARMQVDKETFSDKKKGFLLRIVRWLGN